MERPQTKIPIPLIDSICTDSIDQNTHAYTEEHAHHLLNTGIERNGGLTNIYVTQTNYPGYQQAYPGRFYITEAAQVLSLRDT